jgi:hypothetical protein
MESNGLGFLESPRSSSDHCHHLVSWFAHPDFRRKSCDKGLEAVTKQPRGATMMAMAYQDLVQGS